MLGVVRKLLWGLRISDGQDLMKLYGIMIQSAYSILCSFIILKCRVLSLVNFLSQNTSN